jgi:hypothetical protein
MTFWGGSKMLSKFAHPTAMLVLAPVDQNKEKQQKDIFCSIGCLCFIEAFKHLEGILAVQRVDKPLPARCGSSHDSDVISLACEKLLIPEWSPTALAAPPQCNLLLPHR